MKFIDTAKFMASSLSNLVDNLAEGIQKIECKDCDCFREYESFSDDLRKHKCLSCNRDYSNKLDEKFKKRFKNTFKFSNNDINKFILLLRKGVYPYEYMDEWEKFNETTVPKRVCKDFEIKKVSEYHDLYLKSDTLLLVDVFENFRKMCLKVVSATFLLVCFLSPKKSTCKARKNVFYFTSKALFVLEIIRF